MVIARETMTPPRVDDSPTSLPGTSSSRRERSNPGLPPGSIVLDVGAREGRYSLELSRRFGFTVRGIEPVRRHLDNAARDLAAFAVEEPEAAARVRIDEGIAEKLTDPSGTVDLIWCRDVLVHVEDLEAAFGEFRRVLKPGVLTDSLWGVYQMIGKLNPRIYVLSA
ncbi:class I SAM-dependent methyltransferase [Actinoplanes sp. NPDC051513]|uniref:class I SAM-dependent methyltransferase n=1 Tax=Actinoplanes sp. NPDC051513 TaxID=3363908 RepID=UPI0037921E6B